MSVKTGEEATFDSNLYRSKTAAQGQKEEADEQESCIEQCG